MKLTSMAIVFVIMAFCIVVVVDYRVSNLTTITHKKIEYNKILDSAIEDAVQRLVEIGSQRELILNKENALTNFMNSLYVQFGILDNTEKQDKLKAYIPVIAVLDVDGYYILSNEERVDTTGAVVIEQTWKEKIPYSFEDNTYVYVFTLENHIKIINKTTKEIIEGNIGEIINLGFISEEEFEIKKSISMINSIKEDFSYYINRNNFIAEYYDVYYEFTLPEIDNETWVRSVKDIGFIAVFQGYPYGKGTNDVYNRVCVSAARIKKTNNYYLAAKEGVLYYHKENCVLVNYTDEPYYTKKECALEGAYPCLECDP